jgi:hypothetical protein
MHMPFQKAKDFPNALGVQEDRANPPDGCNDNSVYIYYQVSSYGSLFRCQLELVNLYLMCDYLI